MAASICMQLLYCESENPKKEISMYINSPGGVVTAGMAIYDTMQFIRSADCHLVHRPGRLDGLAAAVRRHAWHALRAAQRAHHGASAIRAGSRARRATSSAMLKTSSR